MGIAVRNRCHSGSPCAGILGRSRWGHPPRPSLRSGYLGGRLGRCDFETWDLPGDAAELQHVTGDHSGPDFSRSQGSEHIIHRPEAVAQPGSVSIHRSKESSGMVESRGCEAEGASGSKGMLNSVNGFLAFGRVGTESEFQQSDSRDEPHDGPMATQDPFFVHACAQEIDQDIGVEYNLSAYW